MDTPTERQAYRQTGGRTKRQTYNLAHRIADRHTDGRPDVHTD